MHNFLVNLINYGVLKIKGIDAKKFLQGQLTCDIEEISTIKHRLAAHCNAKGRIISLFRIFKFDDAYCLHMPINMVPIALQALKKYALFYKVELQDASHEFMSLGLATPTPLNDCGAGFSNECGVELKITENRYILVGKTSRIKTMQALLSKQLIENTENVWKSINIQNLLPEIYPETSEKFLPHELNLHQLNAINFAKGCYTGQEIIARMHYRAKFKKQLCWIALQSMQAPMLNTTIYKQSTHKVCGTIVDVAKQYDQEEIFNCLIVAEMQT